MKNTILYLLSLLLMSVISCSSKSSEAIVRIKTTHGNIKIKLYNETPIHRDNFLKLAKEGYFDGTLFHRVIKDFMIQGGDSNSKGAQPGAALGHGGPDYTLPAEFNYPELFHKKGALAAARQDDQQNPEKRSSGSQFYIVHGEVYDDAKLTKVENKIRDAKRRDIFNHLFMQYNDSLNTLQQLGEQSGMLNIQNFVMNEVVRIYGEEPEFSIPENIKEVYNTSGGTPHLDGNYTVFGEVIEDKNIFEKIGSLFGKHYGLEVIDLIAQEKTDGRNRPLNDVVMEVKVIGE